AQGRLFFFNGNRRNQLLTGHTDLAPRTWYHVAAVRDGGRITIYLNGQLEITGDADVGFSPTDSQFFFGGRNDNYANLEGKLDEVAIFDRSLKAEEVAAHFNAASLPPHAAAPITTAQPAPVTQSAIRRPSDPRSPQDSMKSIHLPPDLA